MPVISTLKEFLPELSRSERKAAEYMIQHPIDVIRYSSSDTIAELSGCSRSAVVRLTQRIGFKGFGQFKVQLAKEMNEYISDGSTLLMDYYARVVENLRGLETSETLQKAAALIRQAKHVYSYGYYHSSYSARQFTFRMIRNGIAAETVDDALSLKEYAHIMTDQDILVIFSISGGCQSTSHLEDLELFTTPHRPKILLLTMTEAAPARRIADVTLLLPCISRMTSERIIDDSAVFFIAIELLADLLAKS